jgi:hypothetical protein
VGRSNSNPTRRPRRLAALLLLVLAGVVLATFADYGITQDEGVQHRYGRRAVRWYATLGAADEATRTNDLYYYGAFFELVAQGAIAALPLGAYDARHLANAAVGLLGVVAAGGIGSRLGGPWAGLLSALFLALTPRFSGEAFANPKDVPFASLFALAAWAALWASERPGGAGWREALVAGLAVGLAAGIRVAGLVLLGFVAILWLGGWWLSRRDRTSLEPHGSGLGRVLAALAGTVAVAWTVMVAFWPWAQLDPLRRPVLAFLKFSRFWPDASVFFEGHELLSGELPRRYLPKLFALTLPEFYAVALLLGVLALLARGPRPPARRVFEAAWVLALAALPLGWIVLRRTPVYNGVRHVLFAVPILAVVAGVAAAAGLARLRSLRGRVAAGAVLSAALGLAVVDMAALHPYEYVYYNRLLAGGLPRAARLHEADYLCATYKEGIEWMAREYLQRGLRERLRVDGNCSHVPFWYYLGEDAVETTPLDPHIFFATAVLGRPPGAPGRVVHVVSRRETPLLYVLEQRAPR